MDTDLESVQVIDPSGDLVLVVTDKAYPNTVASFRVSSARLKESSRYFSVLFDGSKFAEGRRLHEQWKALHGRYGGNSLKLEDAAIGELPVLKTENIGRIGKINNFQGFLTDFFRALHGMDLLVGMKAVAPVNLANLAIVADRFDALDALRDYVSRRRILRLDGPGKTFRASNGDGKRRSSIAEGIKSGVYSTPEFKNLGDETKTDWSEEKCRIRILAGLMLEKSGWVWDSSTLIARGSKLWTVDAEPIDPETSPLWWDLPFGVESELKARRIAVLHTISSLPQFYVVAYVASSSSKTTQCNMFYGNSLQCDTYQLGEMIKFFSRLGVFSLESTMAGTEPKDPYQGDLYMAIRLLKQCPPYQIDKHHAHCGIKDRIVPWLETVEQLLPFTSICMDCWHSNRKQMSWNGTKGLPHLDARRHISGRQMNRFFQKPQHQIDGDDWNCESLRQLFLANDIDWT